MNKVNKLVTSILLSLVISLSFIYSVNANQEGEVKISSDCPITSITCEATKGSTKG